MNRQATRFSNSTADESRLSVKKKKNPFPLLPPQVTDPTERKKRAEGWWGGESRLLEVPVNQNHRRRFPTEHLGTSGRPGALAQSLLRLFCF